MSDAAAPPATANDAPREDGVAPVHGVVAAPRASRRRRLVVVVVAAVAVATLACAAAYVAPLPERLSAPPSVVVEYRDGTPAHVFLSPDEKWRVPVELDRVDPDYVRALLRLEDKRFYAHPGVDPIAIARAAFKNVARGRVVSGGSTITQQLVRVLEPRPRTFASKVVEALRAVQLELRLSKTEILRAYLQFVPYGRNVEGVESAAVAYFGHGTGSLSAAEIATLLAVPQRPQERFPTTANAARLRAARDGVAARLAEAGALPPEATVDEVRATAAPSSMQPFPRAAPHAAIRARAQAPGRVRVATTLDRQTQLIAERLLAGGRDEAAKNGIYNAAVVVVDHRASEVRALVGGRDFWDEAHGGQIAAFDAPRSPGSALKPFLYAAAIDEGIALPDHLVEDVPKTWGGYSPKNYDGAFDGLVRLEDALSRSLNVPFVELLAKIGVDEFTGLLRAGGAKSPSTAPGFYGLSAAIGSLELTPLEMASLYATLARGGEARPLRFLADDPPPTRPLLLFSPGAAYLTTRALALRDRPDFPARRRYAGLPSSIAWKTGTSFGHKDAWSAGYGPSLTAVVWQGNLDHKGSRHLVGAEAAAPLLFDLLEALGETKGDASSAAPPPDLGQVEVCAGSGHLPTPACGHTKVVSAPRTGAPTTRCPYHVEMDVDVRTGRALLPLCRAGRTWRTERFTVWPSSVRRFLQEQARRVPAPPSLEPACSSIAERPPPRIVSPEVGRIALLVPGVAPERQEIPLAADVASGGGTLSWFVDGEYLGSVAADERLWWTPRPGRHDLVVVDEAGMRASGVLDVRAAR